MLSQDIEMEIVIKKPPIWEEAHKHFEIDDRNTIYTYGNTIYNPSGIYLADHIIEHEAVHAKQQEDIGPEKWWELYFTDKEFRLKQELEAYGRQYQFYCTHQGDRNLRSKFLWQIASHLSSDMYKVDISHLEAVEKITETAFKWGQI